MPGISIAAEEAALLAELLRPRVTLLAELLELQVQHSPEGCADWAETADALTVARATLVKLQNAAMQSQAMQESA